MLSRIFRPVINNNSAYIRAVDGIADEFGNQAGVSIDVDGTTDATDTHSTHISESGTVSAHSESSASPAWEALDDVIGSDNNMWQPLVHNGSGWFQYSWSRPKRLVTYKIQCRNHRNGSPNAWTMQGSHTGEFAGEQATVDTLSGVDMVANTNYSFTCDVSTTKYAYHRIVFTQCTVNEGPQFQGIEYFVGAETGDSINIIYDATGDYITGLQGGLSTNLTGSGTASAANGTNPERAFDGNNTQDDTTSYMASTAANAQSGVNYLAYDFGVGVAHACTKFAITHDPQGGNTAVETVPSNVDVEASNDGSTWNLISSETITTSDINRQEDTFTNTVAYRHWRILERANHAGTGVWLNWSGLRLRLRLI